MNDIDVDGVRMRAEDLRRRIDAVARPWDHEVAITAVTKGFEPDVVRLAVDAGFVSIGENYAQELLSKVEVLAELDTAGRRPRVQFIGRLQSNKVRQLTGVVDLWATVDRRSLAAEIAKRDPGGSVLVQVNATGEPQKGGCPPGDVADLVAACVDGGLVVDGLLTVGPTVAPSTAGDAARAEITACFTTVRRLVDDLDLRVCSMGMTGDLELAVAAGSTEIRVGTALFGPRPGRASTDAGEP